LPNFNGQPVAPGYCASRFAGTGNLGLIFMFMCGVRRFPPFIVPSESLACCSVLRICKVENNISVRIPKGSADEK
jgi:hypothetical protein